MPIWVEDKNVGYAHLEVTTPEKASERAHAEVGDEDLEDQEGDDDDALLLQHAWRSSRDSTQVRAFQACDADENEPESSKPPNPKKPKSKAAAKLKQTTLTQPQGVKRLLSLPDQGTAVRSTARSKILAAGLRRKETPST